MFCIFYIIPSLMNVWFNILQEGDGWTNSHVLSFSGMDPSYVLPDNVAMITLQVHFSCLVQWPIPPNMKGERKAYRRYPGLQFHPRCQTLPNAMDMWLNKIVSIPYLYYINVSPPYHDLEKLISCFTKFRWICRNWTTGKVFFGWHTYMRLIICFDVSSIEFNHFLFFPNLWFCLLFKMQGWGGQGSLSYG